MCLLRFHYSIDIFYTLITCYSCVDDGLYSLIPIMGWRTYFPNSISSYFTPMSSLQEAPNMGSLEFAHALNTTIKTLVRIGSCFLRRSSKLHNGDLPVFLSLTLKSFIHYNYKQAINL